jgi:hypothetical protein
MDGIEEINKKFAKSFKTVGENSLLKNHDLKAILTGRLTFIELLPSF